MNFPYGNFYGNIVEDESIPRGTMMLINPRFKPIMLAPGQSINDLSLNEKIELGIDWDATAKASAVIMNIGERKVG